MSRGANQKLRRHRRSLLVAFASFGCFLSAAASLQGRSACVPCLRMCGGVRRSVIVAGVAIAFGGGGLPGPSGAFSMKNFETGRSVVDLGNVLTTGQESKLEAIIGALERDTPYRFRILSPPPGMGPENKADWPDIVKSVKEYWAQSPLWDGENVVVLLASPRMASGRRANPVSFSVANKLTQRLQYRIASDTFTKISNKFGDSGYVANAGEDGAIVDAAVNAIACLRKGVCMQPLSEDEAQSIAFGKQQPVLSKNEEESLRRSISRAP
mmetsp:Transcript_87702/g.195192  ORF Transcript_87702/g.195192 Transcript_87702/m.195192 type:complete len:269 (+) Transcript_87702:159-965(+)